MDCWGRRGNADGGGGGSNLFDFLFTNACFSASHTHTHFDMKINK